MCLQKQEKLLHENKNLGDVGKLYEVLGVKNTMVQWKTMLARITSGRDATKNQLVSWRTKELS